MGVKLGTRINGWNIVGAGGDSAFYNGDWLKRAAVAQAGIYANDAEEATYPLTNSLPNGEPLEAILNKPLPQQLWAALSGAPIPRP